MYFLEKIRKHLYNEKKKSIITFVNNGEVEWPESKPIKVLTL